MSSNAELVRGDDVKAMLEQQWRARIDEITTLSVQRYAMQDPDGSDPDTLAGQLHEQSMVERQLNVARGAAAEIEAALRRLAAGTYGTCEHCSRAVSRARLRARPYARLCAPCQVAAARE